MAYVEGNDHFFRIQSSEILYNGNLTQASWQICHKGIAIIDENFPDQTIGYMENSTPLGQFFSIGTVEELELKFPGLAEATQLLQRAAITTAAQKLYEARLPK
ncbi:MAG: hypothetical protein ACRC8A_12610 [Microcoleaceae cyanobacterium]